MIVDAKDLDGNVHDAFYTYNGAPFTGTGIEWMNGIKVWEASFKNGFSHGAERSWYSDGTPQSESYYVNNVAQGWFRSWHKNGQLAIESYFVDNASVEEKRWDAQGDLILEW